MILNTLLLWLIICSSLSETYGLWGAASIQNMINRFKKESKSCDVKDCENPEIRRYHCDENQVLLQLARLYIISPERIILLLSTNSIKDTCQDIADVLMHINSTLSTCIPLPPENLYIKLYHGLDYFHTYVCQDNENSNTKHFEKYHDCLKELRDDLIECEGPPDWFEKSNKSIVCQFFNEIINCNYIKTAMLCGLTPALILRTFSSEVMKRVIAFNCQVSRSLPHVDDPMPSSGSQICATRHASNCCIFILITCFILISKY